MPVSKHGHRIETMAEWAALGPPKAKHHWKDGRSAKEVARAWLAGGGQSMPSEVHEILAASPLFGPVLSWEAEPEVRLRFDDFSGEPRNSDLLVVARDAKGPYVLAVEAKADEPYDRPVAAVRAAAVTRRAENPRSRGVERVESLLRYLFSVHPGDEMSGKLRYQLLTACAGAVAEAGRRNVSRAVMLVHEFVTAETKDKYHERNATDLRRFLDCLGSTPSDGAGSAVLRGPFRPPGAPGVELFVGKVTRNLRAQRSPRY